MGQTLAGVVATFRERDERLSVVSMNSASSKRSGGGGRELSIFPLGRGMLAPPVFLDSRDASYLASSLLFIALPPALQRYLESNSRV